jgi:translocation and assembly module TamB
MRSKQGVVQGWEQAQLHAALDADGLQSDWQVDLSDNGDIRGTLAVTALRKSDKQLSGQLKLDGIDLSVLDAWLGDYSHFGANLSSALRFSGPLMHPMVHGNLRIDQILAQGDFTPVEIHDGQVELTFSGYQAMLTADLESADGRVSVNGEGQWRDLQAWSSRMNIRSDELLVSIPPSAEIKIRPDLQIQAAPGEAKISGDIYLPWARVEVEELPPSAVSVSSDEVLLDNNLQPVKRDNPMPLKVETDVNVHIGDHFRLAAFGLQGTLSGLLNISQKDQAPFVVGDVEIHDGTYQSFGQDLVINEGTILMNGPVDQPYVAIEAVRNPENIQDNVTAGIKVTGPARQPEIEVFSDPEMPQANALSYLLRGRALDAESGDNSMTMTLIGLSLAQSGKIVGEIGEAFGVSDLQLDTAGSGENSQVTVSGYVLPGLQVKYGVGIFNSLGEVTIRYRLMQDLYLEAVSGLTSTVDLLYQFEFD